MRFVGLLMLGTVVLLAQEVTVTREGSDWVRRQSGAFAVQPLMSGVEVHAQGSIVVQGSSENRVSYTLTQRMGANSRTEAQARQLLGGGGLIPVAGGAPQTMVLWSAGSSGNVTTTLQLVVPQHFRNASLQVGLGGDISVYDFGGNVVALTPSGSIRGGRVHGSIKANTGSGEIRFDGPIDGSVDCSTNAGSITIESAGGRVTCQTGGGQTIVKQAGGPVVLNADGGDISVERAMSSVDARSASGLIEVGQAGGNVIALTRGGSIQVGPARGVRAESGRGRIQVRGVSGPLNLTAAMGNILAELMAGVQIQESSFMSRGGDITVFLPSNLAVSVMATEDSGGNPRIQSDFSEMRGNTFGWNRPAVVQGAINGGGPVLHLSAPIIYLRKTK